MVPCKFRLMASRLSGAVFTLLIPLGSTDPLANVSIVGHHLERKLPTISVIVVADVMHSSGSFLDRARVEAYAGSGVVAAVQFTRLGDVGDAPHVQGRPPFEIGHPEGVDGRVRIIHFSALLIKDSEDLTTPNENQVSHLKASCEDQNETTIVVVTDETCIAEDFWSEPCRSNGAYVFRNYPSSLPSPEEAPRYAYIPLGPRDTFPFIERSRHMQPLASSRSVFFNIQVTAYTSPQRHAVISITNTYAAEHSEYQVHLSGSNLAPYEWVNLLQESKFTICPGGHNPGTFRMFEALETGSIPIVSKEDYLDPAYGAPRVCGEGPAAWNTVSASPFAQAVSVDSWEDLPELLERLARMDGNTINYLQKDCERWYAALMRGKYSSLLNPGTFSKFWPQDGPVEPLSLEEH